MGGEGGDEENADFLCCSTGVPVVDVWSRFMSIAGWKEGMEVSGRKEEGGNEGLKGLLSDG